MGCIVGGNHHFQGFFPHAEDIGPMRFHHPYVPALLRFGPGRGPPHPTSRQLSLTISR